MNSPIVSVDVESGMKKIVLAFWDQNEQLKIKKSFIGRWLVGSAANGLRADDPGGDWDAGAEWAVALTQSGRLAVWRTHSNDLHAPSMEAFDSFDELAADDAVPQNIIAETAAALGVDYETELDV
jgi:hypothetical protein